MISDKEKARFRRNLDCQLDTCDWREDYGETHRKGGARCNTCGSGFTAAARRVLLRIEIRTEQFFANEDSDL